MDGVEMAPRPIPIKMESPDLMAEDWLNTHIDLLNSELSSKKRKAATSVDDYTTKVSKNYPRLHESKFIAQIEQKLEVKTEVNVEIKPEIDTVQIKDFLEEKRPDRMLSQANPHLEAGNEYTSRYLMIEQRASLDGSIQGPLGRKQLEQQYATFLGQSREQKYIGMCGQEYAERRTWEHFWGLEDPFPEPGPVTGKTSHAIPMFSMVTDLDGYKSRLYSLRASALTADKLTLHKSTRSLFTLGKDEKLTDHLFRQLYEIRFCSRDRSGQQWHLSGAVVQRRTEDRVCRDLFGKKPHSLPLSELGRVSQPTNAKIMEERKQTKKARKDQKRRGGAKN